MSPHFIAIEKDEGLAAQLIEKGLLTPDELVVGDALTYSLDPQVKHIVVGNLPYNISVPLLFHFLDQAQSVTRIIAMVQREVAERIAAGPGSKIYGIPSILIQAEADVRILFGVSPGNFRPRPKVDSSVISLTPKPSPFCNVSEKKHFTTLVKMAFSSRRKILSNTLKAHRDHFEAAGLTGQERPETLGIDDFLKLTRQIKN